MTEARNFYKRAIDAYGVVQDFDGAQSALDAMLIIGTQTDDSEDTLRYIKRCIQLAEQTGGDIGQKGRLLTRQGDLQLAKGDINAAVDSFQKAVAALRETDDAVTTGLALSRLGEAYIQQNRIDEGIDTLDSAIVLFHDEHFPGFESKALSTIGNTYLQHQQWAKAEKYDQRALSIAHDQLDQPGEAAQLAALGHLRELQSDPQGAIDYYAQALYVVYVYGSKDLQAKYAFELGRLLVDDTRTLSRGMQLLTESDNLAPSSETKRLLSRANKRSERLTSAGIPQPPAEGEIRDYVGEIYERADAALSSDKVN